MPTLYLLRHAKAAKGTGGMRDFDRPLDPRGLADAEALGKLFAVRFPLPEKVLCSPALRTRQTLEQLALNLPKGAVEFSEPLFDAVSEGYLDAIRACEAQSVLLVGHNPAVSDLAHSLADKGDERLLSEVAKGFPTCALGIFEFDAPFAEAKKGSAHLKDFLEPPFA